MKSQPFHKMNRGRLLHWRNTICSGCRPTRTYLTANSASLPVLRKANETFQVAVISRKRSLMLNPPSSYAILLWSFTHANSRDVQLAANTPCSAHYQTHSIHYENSRSCSTAKPWHCKLSLRLSHDSNYNLQDNLQDLLNNHNEHLWSINCKDTPVRFQEFSGITWEFSSWSVERKKVAFLLSFYTSSLCFKIAIQTLD